MGTVFFSYSSADRQWVEREWAYLPLEFHALP
jgi:hypothetical protein